MRVSNAVPSAESRPACDAGFWIAVAAAAALGGLTVAAITIVVSAAPNRMGRITLLEPQSAQRLEAGRAVYAAQCAGCHGDINSPAAAVADVSATPTLGASGHAMQHSDLDLFQRVTRGARAPDGRVVMPAFGPTLPAEDIVSVLSYVASHWSDQDLRSRLDPDWVFPSDCGPDETPQS